MSLLFFFGGGVGSPPVLGPVTLTSVTVEYYASAAWRDLSSDLVSAEGLSVRYGIDGNGPSDCVASPGEMTFTLRNDAGNSAGLLGRYSPRHANVATGWTFGVPIRLTLTYSASNYVRFYGRVWVIDPVPGVKRSRYVRVVANDTITDLLDADVRAVTLQVNKTETELLSAILDSLPTSAQPLARALDDGVEQIPFAFDNIGEGAKALPLIRDVIQSGYGLYFQTGAGTHRYQNRHNRALVSSSQTFGDPELMALTAPSSTDRCFNIVRTVIHPRNMSPADEADELYAIVVARASTAEAQTAIELAPGETKTMWCAYTDPADRQTTVGGTGVVTPSVASGTLSIQSSPNGGTDLSASVLITLTAFASTAKVVFTNNNAVNAYVNTFIIKGAAVRDPSPQTFEASSVQNYTQPITIDLPYQANATFAQGLAELIEDQYGTLINQVDQVTFFANASDAMMLAALQREPGDMVTLSETVTGIGMLSAVIHQVELHITQRKSMMCSWLLAPAYTSVAPWVLGDGALGTTTVLGL